MKWGLASLGGSRRGGAFGIHLLDLVFADHQDAEGGHCRQRPLERVDVVVVQIDEDEVGEVGQVGDLPDEVVLVVQEP